MKIVFLGRSFRFSWLGVSIYLLLLSLLCSLGVWQLGRAEQKRQFLLQQKAAQDLPALNLTRDSVTDIEIVRYRQAMMSGHYDAAHQFLLDNQILDGKNGYLVLTPFILEGGGALLVNRGWLAASADRKQLPTIDFTAMGSTVKGRINRFPSLGIKLQGVEIPGEGWPSRLQFVDVSHLSEKLGYPLLDFQLELDTQADHGYRREWKTHTAISPEKHLGYAVQWFGLALALTGLFIWISTQTRSDHTA